MEIVYWAYWQSLNGCLRCLDCSNRDFVPPFSRWRFERRRDAWEEPTTGRAGREEHPQRAHRGDPQRAHVNPHAANTECVRRAEGAESDGNDQGKGRWEFRKFHQIFGCFFPSKFRVVWQVRKLLAEVFFLVISGTYKIKARSHILVADRQPWRTVANAFFDWNDRNDPHLFWRNQRLVIEQLQFQSLENATEFT